MLLAASPLIEVVPGLMIWTLVCFAITFFVLRKFAFGPIQKTIDERRERIRSSVEEAPCQCSSTTPGEANVATMSTCPRVPNSS